MIRNKQCSLISPAVLQVLRITGRPIGKTRTIEMLGAGAVAPGKIRRGVGPHRDLFVRRPAVPKWGQQLEITRPVQCRVRD